MPETPIVDAGSQRATPPIPLPHGVEADRLLQELRHLCWGAADILRAYARGEQPPYGFPAALQVEQGGEGPVSAADLAVNQWLLEGLAQAFPQADWTLLSEENVHEQLQPGQPLEQPLIHGQIRR
jgi:3'(2'), 5'-bisphosphate nucleotidase